VAAEAGSEGQEHFRRIRDELERIRDAERRVEEALESVRQARRRVEMIARDLGPEELRVRALVRDELRAAAGLSTPPAAAPAPDEPQTEPEPVRPWRSDAPAGWSRRAAAPEGGALPSALPEPIRVEGPVMVPPSAAPRGASEEPPREATAAASWAESRTTLIGIGAAAVIAVVLIGWLAIRGLQRGSAPGPEPEVAVQETPPAAPTANPPAPVVATPAAPGSVLATLPDDGAGRTALYDSLWAARSPLFDPLLAVVERDSEDQAVARAVASWRAGGVDVQEGDLLHSALVQAALNLRLGRDLELDGQLLRNPCRGASCSALLDLWRGERQRYGLPEVLADAATNTTALRQAETALVLDWMREAADAVGEADAP
jgi:hypothetical protein